MPEHPIDELTPTQGHSEIAAILAMGLLRYLRRVRLTPPPEPPESEQNSLDVCRETRLIGRHGSGGERRGDPETGNTGDSHE
jgi:hypothetical protein